MATQFPIDPEYGRFIQGVADQDQEEAPTEVDMPDEQAEIEELPDGSAVVSMETEGPMEDQDFYQNLAEVVSPLDLDSIAMRYVELIEKDKEAREERDKQYEEGLKRTGLGKDAPGGATFMGASKVVHPVMAEACVDFASRAIKEMFPPDGPVRTKIIGEVNDDKQEVAERKRDYMNWQLTEQIEEFRDEMEQMLTQLPLGGSQYIKLWYDEERKRPFAEFLPIDRMIVPFAAANFYTAQRATEIHVLTEYEFKRRIRTGLYKDVSLIRATMQPDESRAEKANQKIEGKKWQDNEDNERTVYHVYCWLELEDDQHSKGETAPYILMIDKLDNEVVGLYRNWEDGDETMTKLDWVVEFKFIPWRGAYAIGLPHLIGGLSAALTGGIRALLDSAHINNAATMLKLKGAKLSGQSQQVEVTQVAEIEAAPGVDDIRKIAMPMPFNPPSAVLFELVGFLDKAARGVVTTAEEKIADVTSNAPVGTTQALIEQGSAVFSAIHARLHNSQSRLLKILGRLNRWYLEDQRKGEVVADIEISAEDFRRNTDVVPVSDPHIFSETQRMAQIQGIMARSQQAPDLYNRIAVEQRFLKQLKVPGANELLINTADPEEQPSATENAAMAMGQPAQAYDAQDHLSHIQSHLDFAKNPAFGMNPVIAPLLLPNMLMHIKQHMIMWYQKRMHEYVQKAMGNRDIDEKEYENEKITPEVDKMYALASQHVQLDSEKVFAKILPVLAQLMQAMQQMKQKPDLPPEAQVIFDTSMAETQRRAQRDAMEMKLKGQEAASNAQLDAARLQAEDQRFHIGKQIDVAINANDNLTQERIKSAELTRDAAELQTEQYKTAIDLQNEAQRNLSL
jgi:chaperonin GroES